MPAQPPVVDLPDEVTFTLDEVALLLFATDTAVESTSNGSLEHIELGERSG